MRRQSGGSATAANFCSDVNLDGAVNSGDAASTRANSATGVPSLLAFVKRVPLRPGTALPAGRRGLRRGRA
ncbi:MAG: hypothetical protein ACR2ID_11855 [Chthoniobacterales bacterium]